MRAAVLLITLPDTTTQLMPHPFNKSMMLVASQDVPNYAWQVRAAIQLNASLC